MQGLDFATRRQAIAEIAELGAEQFADVLERLKGHAGKVSALHVLSITSIYGLFAPAGDPTNERRKAPRSGRIQQAHVELLQALLLSDVLAIEELPNPDLMQTVFDDLPLLFEAYGNKKLQPPPANADELAPEEAEALRQRQAVAMVQDFLRAHTAGVRNWSHFGAVKRISQSVLSAIDADFNEQFGLSATQLVSLFEHLVRRAERQVSDFQHRLCDVYAAGAPAAMAEELATQFPERDVAEVQEVLRQAGLTAKDARYILVLTSQSIMPNCFVFDAESVADETGLNHEAVSGLFQQLSIKFGDLSDANPEWLLLDNPVWKRPLIRVAADAYFCALPQSLMTFVFPIVEMLIEPNAELKEKLKAGRSDFLEDATETVLRSALPGYEPSRGFKWREGSREYEADLVMRFDTTLLLVESKSGGVSWPALRGAPERMLRDIKNLIVEPSDQSARLALRLREQIDNPATSTPLDFPIPLEGVRTIVRLSVTLHDFATLQSVPLLMGDAGLIKTEHRLAPCMSLADLEAVVTILDQPYFLLHYLRRRAEMLSTTRTIGDEIDMLGMYLDTGFNLGAAEVGQLQLMTHGYSARVDRYFSGADEGLDAKKPRPNVTPWVRSLCEQMMERSFSGWTEVALTLLGMDLGEQLRVEGEVRRRSKKAAAGKLPKDGRDSVLLIPPAHRRTAIAFHIRGMPDGASGLAAAQSLASRTFEHEHVEFCAVVSFVPSAAGPLYKAASLLYRVDRSVETRTYL